MTATSSYLSLAAAWMLSGLVFGLAYFTALRWTVEVFVDGEGRLLPAVQTLGRLVAAVLFLGLATRFGALPLLTAFLGFLLARALALRVARRIA